jgi:hypothetical protein
MTTLMAIYAPAYILYNNSEENLLQVYKNSPEILKKREEECLNFLAVFRGARRAGSVSNFGTRRMCL